MMTTRQLRSSGGRKRLQSNADEVIAKRSKTNDKHEDNDPDNDSHDDEQPVKKAVMKGKVKKGKNPR